MLRRGFHATLKHKIKAQFVPTLLCTSQRRDLIIKKNNELCFWNPLTNVIDLQCLDLQCPQSYASSTAIFDDKTLIVKTNHVEIWNMNNKLQKIAYAFSVNVQCILLFENYILFNDENIIYICDHLNVLVKKIKCLFQIQKITRLDKNTFIIQFACFSAILDLSNFKFVKIPNLNIIEKLSPNNYLLINEKNIGIYSHADPFEFTTDDETSALCSLKSYLIAQGRNDGSIVLYNFYGEIVFKFIAHFKKVTNLLSLPCGRLLSSDNETLCVWE